MLTGRPRIRSRACLRLPVPLARQTGANAQAGVYARENMSKFNHI